MACLTGPSGLDPMADFGPVLDLVQWPAMAVTVAAGWSVASESQRWRFRGFVLFLVSNALWVAWGVHDQAWALVCLQGLLLITNIRGVADNRGATDPA